MTHGKFFSLSFFFFLSMYLIYNRQGYFRSQTYCLVSGFISVSAREHVFCATHPFLQVLVDLTARNDNGKFVCVRRLMIFISHFDKSMFSFIILKKALHTSDFLKQNSLLRRHSFSGRREIEGQTRNLSDLFYGHALNFRKKN